MTRPTHAAAFTFMVICGCDRTSDLEIGATPEALELAKAGSEARVTAPWLGEQDEKLPPGTMVITDAQAAFDHDVAVVAEEQGLSFDEAHASLSYQRDFADYAEGLLKQYPDKLAAIWVDRLPARSGHVVFVGPVPKELSARIGTELRGGGRAIASKRS